jgi:hypothetical protein
MNNLLALTYFHLKMLKFFLYFIQNIHKKTKKFVKNENKLASYLRKKEKKLNNIKQKELNLKKIYNVNAKHLNDWKLDEGNKYSKIFTTKNLIKINTNQDNSFFLDNNQPKKITESYNNNIKFKEFTKIKLPQKKKNIRFNMDSKTELSLPIFIKSTNFYKIPITYFSSFFCKNYNLKNNYSILSENNLKDFIDNQIDNSNTKIIITNKFSKFNEYYFPKSLLFKKILFLIYQDDINISKLKNCKDTKYVVVNNNIFFDKIYLLEKKKRILKIMKFYENSNKYQIANKQFLPYGDIYIFFLNIK